ncbi:MAG: sensor domain-containing diguanylate cyclase [Gammaproteobacteria bacterium]|nr:MAG: sensor domain-containing diguanylate cyclase [Gammaproteobacteria bacterium]
MRTSVNEEAPRGPLKRMHWEFALPKFPTSTQWLTLAALAGVYLAAAKLGLGFAIVHPSASAIWPPAGIALAAWHGRMFFVRPRDIVAFALLAALLSTTVSPTIGLTSLAMAGFAPWADYGHVWLTWWLGDATGDLVVAPVLVLWSTVPPLRRNKRWLLEAAALLAGLSLVSLIVFDGFIPIAGIERLPVEFLCVPFLFWAAFRLGRRALATCTLVLSLIAIIGTLHGLGPFARGPTNESLLLLHAFLAVQAVTMLAAAAVVRQFREAESHLRRQAVRDELTGLANYRCLMGSLEAEIRRAQRAGAGRGFSMLLLDMDRLKQINDRYGHLVGNRALCRLAECLRASCRVTDTAARFGGDEFAIILPETSEAGARQLAERISARMAADEELTRRPQASLGGRRLSSGPWHAVSRVRERPGAVRKRAPARRRALRPRAPRAWPRRGAANPRRRGSR